MIADLIERAEQANSDVQRALEMLRSDKIIELQMACAQAMNLLRRCRELEGASPHLRREIRSTHELCRRVLELEG